MSILEMKVPSPGESISEVEIAQWLVADGDYVEKDQPIAEVDSDKFLVGVPRANAGAADAGVARAPAPSPPCTTSWCAAA
jgi:pyruvate/2-oxoglutarate dehydrogenase complex dihydrolipoamide acyltransferase (E2) component